MTVRNERRRLVPLAIAGLILAFALPELPLAGLVSDAIGTTPRIARDLKWIAIAAILLGWVVFVERLPLRSIGFVRPGWGTLGWGLAATVALLATVMLSFAVIAPALGLAQNMAATAKIVQVPFWLMIGTAIVAGVTEEIVYRGYAIERLEFLTGSRVLAGAIAGIAFLLTHLAWGSAQMIIVAFATLIFVTLYLWRRDLWCCILAHILADAIGFTLARLQM